MNDHTKIYLFTQWNETAVKMNEVQLHGITCMNFNTISFGEGSTKLLYSACYHYAFQ